MRSTDIRTVPATGSTPIDFFVGPQGVGAIVVHNASYRVLTLTLSNGIAVNIAAQRSDLVIIGQATFDGHVVLTPGVLTSAQTDAGSVWLDVYLPGERVVGTYPAPCVNGMTGGNQQPRVQTLPTVPGLINIVNTNIAGGAADTTFTLASFPFGANGVGVWWYWVTVAAVNGAAAAGELWNLIATYRIAALTGGGALVSASNVLSLRLAGVGPVMSPPTLIFTPAFPIVNYLAPGGGAAIGALQVTLHLSNLLAGRTANIDQSVGVDFDISSNATAIPGPGGGLAGFTTPLTSQYTGGQW